jgi:hypothetical protein
MAASVFPSMLWWDQIKPQSYRSPIPLVNVTGTEHGRLDSLVWDHTVPVVSLYSTRDSRWEDASMLHFAPDRVDGSTTGDNATADWWDEDADFLYGMLFRHLFSPQIAESMTPSAAGDRSPPNLCPSLATLSTKSYSVHDEATPRYFVVHLAGQSSRRVAKAVARDSHSFKAQLNKMTDAIHSDRGTDSNNSCHVIMIVDATGVQKNARRTESWAHQQRCALTKIAAGTDGLPYSPLGPCWKEISLAIRWNSAVGFVGIGNCELREPNEEAVRSDMMREWLEYQRRLSRWQLGRVPMELSPLLVDSRYC